MPKIEFTPETDFTVPVMFGDGRTRGINYDQIKKIHSPLLVVTEVLPIKEDLLNQAKRMIKNKELFDRPKVTQAVKLFDQLAIEATEAIATYGGNRWQLQPGMDIPSNDKLSNIFHNRIASGFGISFSAVIEMLKTYQQKLELQKDTRAESMGAQINKIEEIYKLANQRTDPVVSVHHSQNAPDRTLREITFFKPDQNLRHFTLWDAPELNQRHYDYFFRYTESELANQPWQYFVDTYFPDLPNVAEPVSPDLFNKWRQGQVDYFSDLDVDEYRDKENDRWYYRHERQAGKNMVVRVYYGFPDGNETNRLMHEDLIRLIPPELLTDPGILDW